MRRGRRVKDRPRLPRRDPRSQIFRAARLAWLARRAAHLLTGHPVLESLGRAERDAAGRSDDDRFTAPGIAARTRGTPRGRESTEPGQRNFAFCNARRDRVEHRRHDLAGLRLADPRVVASLSAMSLLVMHVPRMDAGSGEEIAEPMPLQDSRIAIVGNTNRAWLTCRASRPPHWPRLTRRPAAGRPPPQRGKRTFFPGRVRVLLAGQESPLSRVLRCASALRVQRPTCCRRCPPVEAAWGGFEKQRN